MSEKDQRNSGPLKRYHIPLCHRLPDRTIYIREHPLPLCARCTGAFLGIFTLPLFHGGIIDPNIINTILLALPATIDATTQYWGWRNSNNLLRLMTGFLLGCSLASLIVIIVRNLINLFLY
ncbi:MAG: DUF2085 domain-containing protein [Methanobacteriaceae archaeon]|nr:DUF2085 domain-containing protein [Methanobacteriaceae archaeon]MDO9627175.1 DUF2085 domain-containing protein [Methanobacteriaceae archaeon]